MKQYFDEYFDMVYFINMPERTDKYENVMQMFSKLGITKYKCIIPIKPDDINISNWESLPPTAKSCKATHLSCYQDALENNYERICVFEDDFCFNLENLSVEENLEYNLAVVFHFLKYSNWNFFFFDNITTAVKKNNKMVSYERYKGPTYGNMPFCKVSGKNYAHSYALTKKGYTTLMEYQKSNNLWNDQGMKCARIENTYLYQTGLFDQILDLVSDHMWNNA